VASVFRRSLTARALACAGLWAGFWALALGLVAALAAVPVAEARFGSGLDAGGVAGGAAALALAWGIVGRWARRRERDPDRGPEPLAEAEFPALHALVRDAARRSAARPPDAILLSGRANASVFDRTRWLGLQRTRYLELGLPLFAALDERELTAVVGHELAHRARGHVTFGAWIHRARAGIGGALDALEDAPLPVDAPFRTWARLFLEVSAAVSRAQELEADAAAAALAGPDAAGGALRKTDALGAPWDLYFGLDAAPLIERGARVALVEGFRRFQAEPRRRPEVEARLAAATPPDPRDTHPPLAERLAALGPRAVAARPREGADCLALLGGEVAAEDAWYRRAVSGPPLRAVGWDDVGDAVLLPALTEALKGGPLDPARLALDALPELVRDAAGVWSSAGRGVNLMSPATRAREGRRLLAEALAAALGARGFRAVVAPGAPVVLRRGEAEVDPAAAVEALREGRLSAEAWRAQVRGWEGEGRGVEQAGYAS
jgi:Zn-dependent protease with chaperone function